MLKKCWFLLLIILSFSAYGEDNNSLYQLEKLRYEIEKRAVQRRICYHW